MKVGVRAPRGWLSSNQAAWRWLYNEGHIGADDARHEADQFDVYTRALGLGWADPSLRKTEQGLQRPAAETLAETLLQEDPRATNTAVASEISAKIVGCRLRPDGAQNHR